MARPKKSHPTDVELQILQILWRRGRITAGKVHAELRGGKGSANSVQTLLQIMVEKKLVRRDDRHPPAEYEALVSEEAIQTSIASDLLTRVFGGSARKLIMHVLNSKRANAEELSELRRRLEGLDRNK
jgi:predicted transcriptional regulator